MADNKELELLKNEICELKNQISDLKEIINSIPYEIQRKTFNSALQLTENNYYDKCKEFAHLFYGDELLGVDAPVDFESFLFFTDPHLVMYDNWEDGCRETIAQIQKIYNSTPTTFCLCGGDWLGHSDLPDEACYKLGFINAFMNSMFDNCYMLLGNHDTNYQGRKDTESTPWTTKLSKQSYTNLWYRNEGKTYFSFKGANTVFYCFDSGAENEPLSARDGCGFEQLKWFANNLKKNDCAHIALSMHMIYPFSVEKGIQPLAQSIFEVAAAFNERSKIEVNGITYDFCDAFGKVEFMISGHTHFDANTVVCGIPCIVTVHTSALIGSPTLDLVFADYGKREVKLIRIGYGENRTISLDSI